MFLYPPREHQLALNIATNKHFEKSMSPVVKQVVTGGGKTLMFFQNAFDEKFGNTDDRFLFVVPQINLAYQTMEENAKDVGILQGSTSRGLNKRVVVATIATLLNRIEQGLFHLSRFVWIYIDEAHKEIEQVRKIQKLAKEAGLKIVFLTATPWTGRGIFIDYLHNDVNHMGREYGYDYMIERGYLVTAIIKTTGELSIDGLKKIQGGKNDGEFKDKELMAKMEESEIDVVSSSLKHIDKKFCTVVVAQNIKHAQELAEEYSQHGVVREIHGKSRHRTVKYGKVKYLSAKATALLYIKEAKDRLVDFLVSVKMLVTGVDIPNIGNIVLATIIGSFTEIYQIIGRGLRRDNDYGKTHVNIIDIYGTMKRHSHPFVPFQPTEEGERREPSVFCKECGSKNPLTVTGIVIEDFLQTTFKKCEDCGVEVENEEAIPTVVCNQCENVISADKLEVANSIVYVRCDCGGLTEINRIVPREMIVTYDDVERAKVDVIQLAKGRLTEDELLVFTKEFEEFIRHCQLSAISQIVDYLSNGTANYSSSSLSAMVRVVKKRNGEFKGSYDESLMMALKDDKRLFDTVTSLENWNDKAFKIEFINKINSSKSNDLERVVKTLITKLTK